MGVSNQAKNGFRAPSSSVDTRGTYREAPLVRACIEPAK